MQLLSEGPGEFILGFSYLNDLQTVKAKAQKTYTNFNNSTQNI
jgi:hypothetical protein